MLVIGHVPQSSGQLPAKKGLLVSDTVSKGPPSSSSSTYGRFTRKSNEHSLDSKTLDSKYDKDVIRSAVLAAELEYEDEYDDSFDDLGLSLVESGYEVTENFNDSISSHRGVSESEGSSKSSNSKWASRNKPQFYVKDGKNYSYKVSGSVAVLNAQDAAIVNQAQKDTIHGLGRGGNLPLGAVKKMMDADKDADEPSDGATENIGRGNANY